LLFIPNADLRCFVNVILIGQSSILIFAVQLSAISRLAKMKDAMHKKCSQLFKLIKTLVKMNLMNSIQECVKLMKSLIQSRILCKIGICVLIYFDRQQSIEVVPFGYVVFGYKMDV